VTLNRRVSNRGQIKGIQMRSGRMGVRTGIGVGVVILLSATQAYAQGNWIVDIGAGTSPTVGDVDTRLTTGWNVDLRGGYERRDGLGVFSEFMYNGFGIDSRVLQSLQVPDGNARMWSLTAGPMWRFPIAGALRGHVLGGVGWYRRTVEFTQPTIGVISVVDPWWGYIGPVVVPANQVLGSVTDNAFGGHIGGGLSFLLGDTGASAFVDVRYHRANTNPTSTAIVPVNVGIRWSGRRSATARP
jgi:hypothetical protein